MNTSSLTLTIRKCSKFNSGSYGFECGTAWVSEFLSFDFTQYETQGLNLPGTATEHPGWGLIRCELAVFYIVRAGGAFSQMPPLQPDTLCISSPVFFFSPMRKKGTSQFRQLLLWAKGLFCHCCWSNTVIQDQLGISGKNKVLEALGKDMVTGPCRQRGGRSFSKAKSTDLVEMQQC